MSDNLDDVMLGLSGLRGSKAILLRCFCGFLAICRISPAIAKLLGFHVVSLLVLKAWICQRFYSIFDPRAPCADVGYTLRYFIIVCMRIVLWLLVFMH